MLAWFEAVERVSPRLRVESIGQATEGAEMVLLTLSANETIAGIERARAALLDALDLSELV
jgi:hypothetical protein